MTDLVGFVLVLSYKVNNDDLLDSQMEYNGCYGCKLYYTCLSRLSSSHSAH